MTIRGEVGSLFAGLLLSIAAAAGCAHLRPPYRSDGPAVSAEGVRLTLRGQSCAQSYDVDRADTDQLVEETVAVEILNPTTAVLMVRTEEVRLGTSSGAALRTLTPRGATPIPIGPGETRLLELRFMASGMSCSEGMSVESNAALELNQGLVKVPPVRFVPSRLN
jgi:hypothetical protein